MTVFAGAERVTADDHAPVGDAPDYSKMTNPQLAALCRERGIEVPSGRPTKAQLIELLEEQK